MSQSFTGSPFDVASLFEQRTVDDGRLDPPAGGWPTKDWVNGLEAWQDDVFNTHASEWAGRFIMNNHSATGEQTALYAQYNGDAGAGWGAAFVAEANGAPGHVTVSAEFDGRNVAAGINYVAAGGSTDAAILIDARPGATINTGIQIDQANVGLDIHSAQPLVEHGTGTQALVYNADTGSGIFQINTAPIGAAADFHLVGVANMGTDHMHASVLV